MYHFTTSTSSRTTNALIVVIATAVACFIVTVTVVLLDHQQRSAWNSPLNARNPHVLAPKKHQPTIGDQAEKIQTDSPINSTSSSLPINNNPNVTEPVASILTQPSFNNDQLCSFKCDGKDDESSSEKSSDNESAIVHSEVQDARLEWLQPESLIGSHSLNKYGSYSGSCDIPVDSYLNEAPDCSAATDEGKNHGYCNDSNAEDTDEFHERKVATKIAKQIDVDAETKRQRRVHENDGIEHEYQQQDQQEQFLTTKNGFVQEQSHSSSTVELVDVRTDANRLQDFIPISFDYLPGKAAQFLFSLPNDAELVSKEILLKAVRKHSKRVIKRCQDDLSNFYQENALETRQDLNAWKSLQSVAPESDKVSSYLVKVQELPFIKKFRDICDRYEKMEKHKLDLRYVKLDNEEKLKEYEYYDGVNPYMACMEEYIEWRNTVPPAVWKRAGAIRSESFQKDFFQMATNHVAKQMEGRIKPGLRPKKQLIRIYQRVWHSLNLRKAFNMLPDLPEPIRQLLLFMEENASKIESCSFDRITGSRLNNGGSSTSNSNFGSNTHFS